MTRRQMLATFGAGFGSLGFRALGATSGPTRTPHFAPKAKQVVFLFLNGGPSQVDTFDPKPALTKYNGKPLPGETLKTERRTGNAFGSPFQFNKYGQSG